MRILFALLALPLLVLTAQAEAATTSTTTKSTTTHMTMDQRFQQANVTHDGHLTEDQAKTGYKSIARHFAAIDQDKKGYITEDDIRTYDKLQRILHQQSNTTKHATN
jgi:uncharacterized secreted protein with C-terminal beta-propeller domain